MPYAGNQVRTRSADGEDYAAMKTIKQSLRRFLLFVLSVASYCDESAHP
jgi:hypothetical protein